MAFFFGRRLGSGLAPEDLYGKPKPKKFNYSSEVNSRILERGIGDLAAVSETTSSAIIEDALISMVMPSNKRARTSYSAVLLGEKLLVPSGGAVKHDIREELAEMFEKESAGTDWKAAHRGAGRSLVEFAYEVLSCNRVTLVERSERSKSDVDSILWDVENSWDSIVRIIDDLAEEQRNAEVVDFSKYTPLRNMEHEARAVDHSLKEDPFFLLSHSIRFLLQSWDLLGDSAFTWRFLHHLMLASKDWVSTPEERLQFKAVLQSVYDEWDAFETQREGDYGSREKAAALVSYSMKDGAVVRVPKDWVVVNLEDAPDSLFAGAIEVKNGESFNVPNFLFFLKDHPVSEMTELEQLEIRKHATAAWPRFAEVQDAEVELRYGPDGGVLNQKEWMSAPMVGMFAIQDKGKYPTGKPPYGAVVERSEEAK